MNLRIVSPLQGSPGRSAPSLRRSAPEIAGALVALVDLTAIVGAGIISDVASTLGWSLTAAVLLALVLRGHYRLRISLSLPEEATGLVSCLAISLVLISALAGNIASIPVLVRTGLIATVLLLAGRGLAYAVLRGARSRGWLVEPTLIIGAGQVAAEVARAIQQHPEYGLRPVGFLDSCGEAGLPAPILGPVDRLSQVLDEYAVRRVIIAFGMTPDSEMVRIVRTCERKSVEIYMVPRLFELGADAYGAGVDELWGLPLRRLRRSGLQTSGWRMKRWMDVAVAVAGMVVLAPVYGAIMVAVRLSSPGPVLFRQERVGQDGRLITVMKFRTMLVNGDSDTTWSVAVDDRITSVGRTLRRTGLDELPQLLNVLRGDMSLVGPRPERPGFVQQFGAEIPRYDDRHRVRPGMTGSAQVHGLRGDTSISQRTRFDLRYIENWSLWLDVVLIFRTVRTLAQRSRRAPSTPSQGTLIVARPEGFPQAVARTA